MEWFFKKLGTSPYRLFKGDGETEGRARLGTDAWWPRLLRPGDRR
jgi:hypothetical protein